MPAKRWIWTLLRKCCAAMGSSMWIMCTSRGSMLCAAVLSTSFPFRPSFLSVSTFFGDEVESIRTFEVESQLSKEKKEEIVIVPDLSRSLEQGGMVAWFLSWIFCGRIPCWRCVISFGCGSYSGRPR